VAVTAALEGLEGAAVVIARVDELSEGAVTLAAAAHEQALREERRAHTEDEEHHRALYRRLPVMMHSIDARGRLFDVNDCWIEALGYTREEALGRPSTEFLTEESRRYAREVVLPEFFRTGHTINAPYQFVKKDGSVVHVLLSAVCDRDAAGNVVRSYAVLIDVTDLRRAEAAARQSAVQEETIRAQEEMLRALSTPLVPLGGGAVLMPIIGAVDRPRAEQMMGVLLEGVVAQAASIAILDVTGVPAVDEAVAAAIARATRAVRLLGAEVVLTGLGPAAARAIVELGVDLGGVITRGTLRDGIAYALRGAAPRRRVGSP
jgi:rsbT co-antagonist protein RsbR